MVVGNDYKEFKYICGLNNYICTNNTSKCTYG